MCILTVVAGTRYPDFYPDPTDIPATAHRPNESAVSGMSISDQNNNANKVMQRSSILEVQRLQGI